MSSDNSAVTVDPHRVKELIGVIRMMRVPPPEEEQRPALEDLGIGNFYLLIVGICHQTKSLKGSDGKRGWDYLQAKLRDAVERDASLLTPQAWENFSAAQIDSLMEDHEIGRTLSDAGGRAELIQNMGRVMRERGWSTLDDLRQEANDLIEEQGRGLAPLLALFHAYDDPVRKKTMFLLGIMQSMLKWHYRDPQNLHSPVDYHEVRGHLRIGTVRIEDKDLEQRIFQGVAVPDEDDVAIRKAVAAAISQIAAAPGLPDTMKLHYLFWYLFRHVCAREGPHCAQCPKEVGLPERYDQLVVLDGKRRCPFARVCQVGCHAYLEHEMAGSNHWY